VGEKTKFTYARAGANRITRAANTRAKGRPLAIKKLFRAMDTLPVLAHSAAAGCWLCRMYERGARTKRNSLAAAAGIYIIC
jgi:hypothetical protein